MGRSEICTSAEAPLVSTLGVYQTPCASVDIEEILTEGSFV